MKFRPTLLTVLAFGCADRPIPSEPWEKWFPASSTTAAAESGLAEGTDSGSASEGQATGAEPLPYEGPYADCRRSQCGRGPADWPEGEGWAAIPFSFPGLEDGICNACQIYLECNHSCPPPRSGNAVPVCAYYTEETNLCILTCEDGQQCPVNMECLENHYQMDQFPWPVCVYITSIEYAESEWSCCPGA